MTERPIAQWMRLRNTRTGDGAIEVPSLSSGIETGFGAVRLAIGPEGQPRLMVPCGAASSIAGGLSSDRLSVTMSRYEVAGRATRFIDVMCTDRSLDSVFAELASEVVHRIASGEGAVEAVEGTIADFRDLLSDAAVSDVPDHEIIGLIGELFVLRELVRGSASAICAWTGPFDQRHDFRRGDRAIEVKTSSRADTTSIHVSSIDQLSEPIGGSLLLVHLHVERAANGELAVSSLCGEIVRSGVAHERLAEALAAMGCPDPDSAAWNRIRFSLEKISGYRVDPGFPRLTAKQFPGHVLPDGILSVAYEVDLRAASEFRVPDNELASELAKVIP
ncbi:PD-(D/E)XK motif protein [Pseudoxanthomonas sp.]|jgi:hypothetical protein|uniref:PD-(D/E)XK motif protein n=1 Tax=Pseudoxanthomonas sp. TaxID=1871049 RepID=UPI002E0E783D|nr:PD-(D/E)XK motif protein [Pseudoxanthomonas sp.]